jgi:hypothetical protein
MNFFIRIHLYEKLKRLLIGDFAAQGTTMMMMMMKKALEMKCIFHQGTELMPTSTSVLLCFCVLCTYINMFGHQQDTNEKIETFIIIYIR